jgi:hypothetical protein
MSNTPQTDSLVITVFGVEFPSRDLIKLARMMERELMMRPKVKLRKKVGRPRIPTQIQKQIAETPLSVKDAHLAKSLKVSSNTVARYRKMLSKEAA